MDVIYYQMRYREASNYRILKNVPSKPGLLYDDLDQTAKEVREKEISTEYIGP